jgi:hypothetical protein
MSEGLAYLAQLRGVLLAYRPGSPVTTPLEFPVSSAIFDGRGIDTHLLDDVLENDLGIGDRTRRRLMDDMNRRLG